MLRLSILPLLLGGVAGVLGYRMNTPGNYSNPVAPADVVIYGRVWTGDSAKPWAQAVAISGEKISGVGDSSSIAAQVGPGTRVIRKGAMVVPGFMDGHTHFIFGGFQLTQVDLRDADSPEEFVRRIKNYAAKAKPGEWILGGNWDHERWAGTPLPDRSWIDSVTPNNPVFVDRLDGHKTLANSVVLKLAHLDRSTKDVAGGTIVRRPDGEPTGVVKDAAQNLVYAVQPTPSPQQSDAAIDRAMHWAASHGVTAVADVSVPWFEVAALRRAHAAGRMITRVAVFVPLQDWRLMADTVRADGVGDDWLRVAGVKGYVDGSLGSTTALFYEPYNDAPQTSGLLVTPEDSLRSWIGSADSAGLQVAVHAIGQRANGLILDIYDSLAKANGPRDRRFRIEHAQHLRRKDIDRIAKSGVIASMQPYHAIDDGRWAEKRIGPERIKTTYAFRSLLDAGAHLAFGSDWTVAPLDPILGIYAAVTRRTLDGKHPEGWVPEQKISVEEALRAYTAGNAYGVFAEAKRGKLKPGYLADIVILEQDLTKVKPEALEKVRVQTTIVGGKTVYQR
ncbi:MAG TPA: amidohydrolase [Gemmatimonadales bacterium]|nr:amidohydrolase [Gemmatimonadales bacterium]